MDTTNKEEIATYFDRRLSLAIAKGILECEFTKKEYSILKNSNNQKDFMLNELSKKIDELIREIQKRDGIINNLEKTLEKTLALKDDIKELYHKELRKNSRRIVFGPSVTYGVNPSEPLNPQPIVGFSITYRFCRLPF